MNARTENTVSVVMCCYHGDTHDQLIEAVDSILAQTLQPTEFIIVVDGPVDADMNAYLEHIESNADIVCVSRLEQNKGTAAARNHGMSIAQGEYIAIMDSDDIALPQRLEVQLRTLQEQGVDAVWSWQDEFYSETGEHAGCKRCPETHDEILASLKWRNLLPDPATFISKRCFEGSGGYHGWGVFGIDYVFFWNMALAGFRFYCIQQPLIRVRVSAVQRRRRGGWGLFRQDVKMRRWMLDQGVMNPVECAFAILLAFGFRMVPNGLRDLVYRRVLRK